MTDEQRTDERRKLAPELVAIHARLDTGDVRMGKMETCLSENTAMTQKIMQNTSGLVAFSDDLASGSRFLCRIVKAVQFILKEVIDPYWKPVLVVFVVFYGLTHDQIVPDWLLGLYKLLGGGAP